MLKFKGGVVSTASIFIFLIFGIFLFLGIKGVLEQFIVSAQTNFLVNLKADDRGTEMLSFLTAEKDKTKNIETLGYFDASDRTDLSYIESSLDKMRSIEGENLTLNIFNKKTLGGKSSNNKIFADIPLPGGKIGRIELIL